MKHTPEEKTQMVVRVNKLREEKQCSIQDALDIIERETGIKFTRPTYVNWRDTLEGKEWAAPRNGVDTKSLLKQANASPYLTAARRVNERKAGKALPPLERERTQSPTPGEGDTDMRKRVLDMIERNQSMLEEMLKKI